ncbi:MAG TPA: LacI family DNA-binding transcriptional regulator [Chthonomonadaceae bacterium]|nr:LacI family DNA-binding transcriptional regulator [Chthonomonadaceae bacterium]
MTIKELAREIGVSPTTVSRVMHGRGRISSATRQKVLERVREVGYTPNVNAQRLTVGRTHLVALDFGGWHDFLADMFFVELTRGVQDALEAHGYGLLLNEANDVLRRWVKSRAVDGVILAVGGPPDARVPRDIASTGTPCVVIGHHPLEGIPGVGSVVVGLRNGAQEVARKLVACGHRRIGFLGNQEPQDAVLLAFREELKALGVALCAELVIPGGRNPADGERAMRELLMRPDRPTAVFARTDALAAGALRAARRLGISVPTELSLVGHDDVPFAELAEPPLTTVRVNCIELGKVATEILISLLQQPGLCPAAQVVQTALVERESVAPPKQ